VLAALREMRSRSCVTPAGISSAATTGATASARAKPTATPRARLVSIETNQFGTNEFIDFCRTLGCEPMLGMNFGTGSIQDASDYVEYCNAPAGTKWSDLRKAHGYAEPHK
jgi:alpha-N-arabinofuranosidase